MQLTYKVIEREVYNKKQWALLIKNSNSSPMYSTGWVLTTWSSKPKDKTVEKVIELFARSCEIFYNNTPRPSFDLNIDKNDEN